MRRQRHFNAVIEEMPCFGCTQTIELIEQVERMESGISRWIQSQHEAEKIGPGFWGGVRSQDEWAAGGRTLSGPCHDRPCLASFHFFMVDRVGHLRPASRRRARRGFQPPDSLTLVMNSLNRASESSKRQTEAGQGVPPLRNSHYIKELRALPSLGAASFSVISLPPNRSQERSPAPAQQHLCPLAYLGG